MKDFNTDKLEQSTGLKTRFAKKINSNLFWGFEGNGETKSGVCILDSATGGQVVVNDENLSELIILFDYKEV